MSLRGSVRPPSAAVRRGARSDSTVIRWPDVGEPRRLPAGSRRLESETGAAHQHRAEIDGLQPDTLYAFRVQGAHWPQDGELRYEACTATGRVYEAFSLVGDRVTGRRIVEHPEGRIGQRDCPRDATLKGRTDRCWE